MHGEGGRGGLRNSDGAQFRKNGNGIAVLFLNL
jgi:hypothetical protein